MFPSPTGLHAKHPIFWFSLLKRGIFYKFLQNDPQCIQDFEFQRVISQTQPVHMYILHSIVLLAWVKFSVEIIGMGHTNFLINVEVTWVEDLGSSLSLHEDL